MIKYRRNNLDENTHQLFTEACERATKYHMYLDFYLEYLTGGVVIMSKDLNGNKRPITMINYDDHDTQQDIIIQFITNLMLAEAESFDLDK